MDSAIVNKIDQELYRYLEYFSPFFSQDRDSFFDIHNNYIQYIENKYRKIAGLDDFDMAYRILDIMRLVQLEKTRKKERHWIMDIFLGAVFQPVYGKSAPIKNI